MGTDPFFRTVKPGKTSPKEGSVPLVFSTVIQVGFEHTDVAGVVYYPRYFEMLSKVVERWFQQELGVNYRQFHIAERRGIPLVEVHCRFMNPSFLSDVLDFRLSVKHLGRSSAKLHIEACCRGEQRLEADLTIVHSQVQENGMRSAPFPPDLAARMREYLNQPAD
jgi:4-hydroxybenzoyl-CoA thioesterase